MSEREHIPYIDIKGFQGLYTKSSPSVLQPEQLRVAQNCDFFEEYGAIAKIRGSSRVLDTAYQEDGAAAKIPWIAFYKAPDLDGTILRHTLVAAGTILGRVEGGAITPLLTGRTADLYHTADRLDRFMFITNYNPDRVGEGDQLVKYDGAVMTNWGIAAPGTEETVIEAFDKADHWDTQWCTVEDQSNDTVGDVTWDGDATKLDAVFYSSDIFSVEKSQDATFYPYGDSERFYVQGDGRNNEDAINNRVSFFTYFPRGTLTASLTSPIDTGFKTKGPVMSVYVSPDSDTIYDNHWRFDFSNGALVEGWNKINLDFASGPPGGGSLNAPPGDTMGSFYPETQPVGKTKFEFYLSTAQTTVSGIRLDRYEKFDEGAPVGRATGTGGITGTYMYKVVYVSKYGNLSNAGPATVEIIAASNAQIDLTRIPVSSDLQVTGRRLYRTVGNGSVWLYLDEILDNTSTTYTDTTADGSLGQETPPQAGDYSDDNSVPPKGGIVKVWKKTVFMAGDPQNPYTLYYSEDDEPESFPLINAFELDAKITAIYETYSGLVVETETGKWQVIGDNPDFSVDKIVQGMGCVGRRAAGSTKLIGFAVDRDGMRLYDGSEPKKISEPIRDKYDSDIDKANIELIHTVHSRAKNLILQFNPDASGNYTSIFAYQYPIDSVGTGYWTTINTPTAANLNFLAAVEIEDSNGDFQLLASGADGMIYRLFNNASKNWVGADGTTYAIDSTFTIPYLRLGLLGVEVEGVTGRVAPHSVELNVGSDDACVWTATVETADGVDQTLARSSSTITMEFGTNNSLIRQRVPNAETTPADYVRLTLQNNEKDVYTKILATRFYYHVQSALEQIIDVDNTTS